MFEGYEFRLKKVFLVIDIKSASKPNEHLRFNSIPSHCELIYFLSGNAVSHFGGKTMYDSEGSIRYLPACVDGKDYTVDVGIPTECIDIYFDAEPPFPQEAFSFNYKDNRRLRDLFLVLYKKWLLKNEGYAYDCAALFYQILAEIYRADGRYYPEARYERIRPAVDAIASGCFDPSFSCTKLAETCGMSYSYFKKLFSERFGLSPVHYVMQLRLQKAVDLLNTGLYKVTEISEMSGFSDVYYFSRVFRQHYGCPPSRYHSE